MHHRSYDWRGLHPGRGSLTPKGSGSASEVLYPGRSASGGGGCASRAASASGDCLKGGLHLEGVCIRGVARPPAPPEIHGLVWDTVNKRMVRLLLECFLVEAGVCKCENNYRMDF